MKVLLFYDDGGASTLLSEFFGPSESVYHKVVDAAMEHLKCRGVKPYYVRFFIQDGDEGRDLVIDYGSHTKFLRVSPAPRNISILFNELE